MNKTVEIAIGPYRFEARIELDRRTWRWTVRLLHMHGEAIEVPAGVDLSARNPNRAAAKAVEWLLGAFDRDELKR